MSALKKIVLFGAGGMGREIAGLVKAINQRSLVYDVLGFLDENKSLWGKTIDEFPVLGATEWMLEHKDTVRCTCTIGSPKAKAKVQGELMAQGIKFETIISPDVVIPKSTTVGAGCVFYPKVSVSVDMKIGAGVLLNTGVTLGHDVEIGDYTCVMPGTGISGACKIGTQVNIGGHAFIIPGKKVGDFATVAAGSIVFSNVKKGATVLGNPAKRMECLEV